MGNEKEDLLDCVRDPYHLYHRLGSSNRGGGGRDRCKK